MEGGDSVIGLVGLYLPFAGPSSPVRLARKSKEPTAEHIASQAVQGPGPQANHNRLDDQEEAGPTQSDPIEGHEQEQDGLHVQRQPVVHRGHVGEGQEVAVSGVPQGLIHVAQVHAVGGQGGVAAHRQYGEGEHEGQDHQPQGDHRRWWEGSLRLLTTEPA